MTDAQLRRFRGGIANLVTAGAKSFHHGCCVGADEQAAVAVVAHHAGTLFVVGHPPENQTLLSRDAEACCCELRNPRPYMTRNQEIVEECDVLVACPRGPEERRSGTWTTVRMARRAGRRVVVVWPDGTVTWEPQPSA